MRLILDAQNVTFSYGAGPIVLFRVELVVEEGQIVGLVGPNGSGKSTLINLVCDNLELAKGSIRVGSHEHRSVRAKREAIYLPSEDFLPDFLTGREYFRAVERMYGGDQVSAAAMEAEFDALGMAGREDDLIEDFSHGMKKKLQFLTAFLLERPLTIIDETFNGIDLDAQRYCMRKLVDLRRRGKSTLLCTHDFALLEDIADEVVVMKRATVLDRLSLSDLRQDGLALKAQIDEMLFGDEHESV